MHVEVSTDTRVTADVPVTTAAVEAGLVRFRDRLTRVEVHLSDVNGPKGGRDVRCALEARAAGRQPVAVTNEAHTADDAVKGAVEKMKSLLTATFGREGDAKGGPSASGLPT
ncbi:ribosomal subunit interface protein [bacterium]|nr:ribosomal subunit interface protein [bacterium]